MIILVVDDDTRCGVAIERLLTKKGNLVVRVEDGGQGLALLGHIAFDLILSDIMMPKMDGITFYHKVSESHPEMATKFVFITASPELLSMDPKTKVVPYLEKPVVGEIFSLISQYAP